MITEIAQIDVKPGMETEFEAGVTKAAPLFKRAKGCTGMRAGALARKAVALPAVRRNGTRWKTTRSTSASPPISRNGASWSAIASPRRRTSSMCTRW